MTLSRSCLRVKQVTMYEGPIGSTWHMVQTTQTSTIFTVIATEGSEASGETGVVISMLQMRNLRPRKLLVAKWSLNPGLPDSKAWMKYVPFEFFIRKDGKIFVKSSSPSHSLSSYKSTSLKAAFSSLGMATYNYLLSFKARACSTPVPVA